MGRQGSSLVTVATQEPMKAAETPNTESQQTNIKTNINIKNIDE